MWLHYLILIYIVSLGLLLGTGKKNKNLKKGLYIFLTFGLFTFLTAFRSKNVGNDTIPYLELFKWISMEGDISTLVDRYEIGYLYLNKLIGLITTNPQIIIVISSLIIMVGFGRFIYKHSKIPWLSTYLFFALGYYANSMNTIRLYLALVVILYSYEFLKKSKFTKFLLLVIIASLFHRTAIVFLLAWPISKLKFKYKTVITAIIISLLIYITFPTVMVYVLNIFPNYSYYLGSEYLNGDVRIASVMNLVVGISIALLGYSTLYHKTANICGVENENSIGEREKNKDGNLLLLLVTVGILITFISFNFNLLARVAEYFLVFACVYLPNSIYQLKDKKLLIVVIYLVVTLFFIYATTIQILRPEWHGLYPYKFFWND